MQLENEDKLASKCICNPSYWITLISHVDVTAVPYIIADHSNAHVFENPGISSAQVDTPYYHTIQILTFYIMTNGDNVAPITWKYGEKSLGVLFTPYLKLCRHNYFKY